MKKPIISFEERSVIETDSFSGAVLRLQIAILHFRRELDKSWFIKNFSKGLDWMVVKIYILAK